MNLKLRRVLSFLLALIMVVQYVPATVLATEGDSLCEHHTEHTAACGYVEGESNCAYHCDACLGHDHDVSSVTEPVTEATEASTEPSTQATEEVTEPSTEDTEPSAEPTEPETESVEIVISHHAAGQLYKDGNGYYMISTAQELQEFATLVNAGEFNAFGQLMADIDMSGVSNWVPIGMGYPYTGRFNGQGYSVKNLNISFQGEYSGLFGRTGNGAHIQNLSLENVTIQAGGSFCGGLVGHNQGIVEKCSVAGQIVQYSQYTGGLIGLNQGQIGSCYAAVIGPNPVCGNHQGSAFGYIAYNYDLGNGGIGTAASTAQFTSGEVAYALGWGQDLDNGKTAQAYPSLKGAAVKKFTNCNGATIYSNLDSYMGHLFENGVCKYCGGNEGIIKNCDHSAKTYTDKGSSHAWYCAACHTSGTESHSYENGLCICGRVDPDAAASLSKNGTIISGGTLAEIITQAQSCTAEDKAVVKLLKDIDLGNVYQRILGGTFTIDLNGKTLTSAYDNYGALTLMSSASVTITGPGKIIGNYAGVEAIGGSQLVMNNVECSAASNAVQIGGTGSSGEFTDCSITSGENAVSVFSSEPTIFRNCEITGQLYLQEASSNYPDVRVFGGSFPAGLKASFVLRTKLTLKLDENGHGPTVHGDINVEGSTLNAILDEGLAYWAGDTMLSVADKATSITGKGDITIKAACTHSGGAKGSYVNNDSNHSFSWSCCGLIVDEDHRYGNNGLCLCGAVNPDAVATLSKDSQVVFAATTLNAVIREAIECAAGDKAVVQLLQDVPMGEKTQGISDGVFTLDLNGRTISNTAESLGAVTVSGSNTAVTIRNGTISGDNSAVYAFDGGKATLENMTLTAVSSISTGRDSEVILRDCVVTASVSGLFVGGGAVYVYDSVINGDSYDISISRINSGSVVLREGASFPGGITVSGTTLNEILDDGLAYWAGDTMLSVADGAESITGKGDISVKAACTHENGTKGSYVYNDINHSFSWSCCGLTVDEDHSFADGVCLCGYECAHQDAVYTINQDNTHTLSCGFCKVVITEDHKYDPTTAQCICGVQAVAQSTIGATVTYHLTLGEAIAAVSSAVESDKAVVKLLCDIDLGGSKQEISSGAFTLDLNGCALVNLAEDYVLSVTDGADLTIADSGTDGEIRSMHTSLNLVSGTLSITGGVIHGENNGVYSEGGTLMISGGSISGGTYGVYTLHTQMVTITGGTFSGKVGVASRSDTLSISGGTFTGTECGLETYDRAAIISGGTFDGGSMGVRAVGSDAVTITGGMFSGDHALLSDICDTVEITGGSFCGNTADLGLRSKMQFVLGLGEDGTGPIFPGGISLVTYAYSDTVAVNVTLLDILDEDLVYWKNGNPIFVSDDQTEISGGDVTVGELNCDHTGNTSEEYTDNGDETHSLLCSDCGFPIATEGHTMDANQPCICGVKPAVMTTIGENTCCYALLSSAVTAMADTTAEDKAVLKLLEDIDLGDSNQNIDSGVFTLDLNGKCLSGGMEYSGVINVNDANLTITDSGIGGTISGFDYGVCAFNQATITITGGIITGRIGAESNSSAEIIITGGSICGTERGVSVDRGFLYVRGGTVSSDEVALYAVRQSDMIISGGTISGGTCDIYVRYPENVDIWLTLSEEGTGPVFPGGLTVSGTTLSAILEEGAACWQHGERITVSADQTEIIGGDVYILPDCDHSGSTTTELTNNGDGTHSGICSVCGFPYTQPHTEDYTYLNLQEQGHKAYYPCCETPEDVEISEHSEYECDCGYLELMTLSFYAVEGDETPVATFQVPYYTELIRWDYDEETGERIPVFSDYLENLLSQIDTTGLTREHYTFGGWDFGENRIMYDDIDICGVWNPVRYNITWDLAGGYAKDPDYLPTAAYYGSGIVLWTRILREGYVLSHFVDQNGVIYSMVWASDHWSIYQGMPGHDIVLTAVWEEVHTCVHSEYKAISESEHQSFCQCGKPIGEPEPHDYNNQKHQCICEKMEPITVRVYWYADQAEALWTLVKDYGTTTTIPTGAAPEGHTFLGYAKTRGGEVFLAAPESGDLEYAFTESVDLYPVFAVNSYKLTVTGLNGEELVCAGVVYGSNVAELVPLDKYEMRKYYVNATGNGYYDFEGWLYDAEDTNEWLEDTLTMPDRDLTVFAEGYYTGWVCSDETWTYEIGSETQTGLTRVIRFNHDSFDPYELFADDFGWVELEEDGSWSGKYINETFADYEDGLWILENGTLTMAEEGYTLAKGQYLHYIVEGIDQGGLQKVGDDYYFFASTGHAATGKYTAWATRCDLPVGTYEFGADGRMLQGLIQKDNGIYYYVNGRLGKAGLTKIGEDYYFVSTIGRVATGKYYAWATNCDLPCGNYEFGSDGRMLQGIVMKADGPWLYRNGKADTSKPGITKVGDYFYFVSSIGRCAVGNYYCWATNCAIPVGNYHFDEQGRMTNPPMLDGSDNLLTGLVEQENGIYYYVNGKIGPAGLTKIGDYYYFVSSVGRVATGSYYCWATNCSLPCGTYKFDDQGRMLNPPAVGEDGKLFTGLKQEENGIYYYVNGKIGPAGLTKIGDDYYFVSSIGRVATGEYYCWATNCDLPCGLYTFAADGRMIR